MTTPETSPWAPTRRPDLGSFVPRERRIAPLVLWLACLAGALALLLWLGDGRLAAPDLTDPSSWTAWAQERGTADVVVALLRVVALGLAWYLVGVTAVSVIAHAARAARLVRIADALSVGPVRTVVQQALGLGLAVGVVATALPPSAFGRTDAAAATATVTAAAMVDDPAGEVRSEADDPAPPVPGPQLVATSLADPGDAAPSDPATRSAPDTIGATGDVAAAAGAPGDDRLTTPSSVTPVTDESQKGGGASHGDDERREVRVAAGDHLWGIAEEDLRSALGRDPSEGEVHGHWQRVVEANLERLVVPSNPDLLQPGQRIVLPEIEVSP